MAIPFPVPPNAGAPSADPPPSPRRRRIRLDSIDRIRHELGKIYREARDGDRDSQEFSRLANGLSILGRLVEGSELERRVEALEAKR